MKIRGLMLDMARVTERFDHYMDVVRACPGWGYNTLFAHVTDNEGCAVVFGRRPELATPNALTSDQVKQWNDAAQDAGVTIVPEIECFGHTRFIHEHPDYKHLAMPCSGHFNAINPLHPETREVLNDLITDAAAMFDSPYIHAGFDEVNLGDTSVLGESANGKEPWELFADMVVSVHDMITRQGKRMIIWGDHLVSEPRISERIPKDIVIADWQYHADVTDRTPRLLTGMGFEVIACPASSRSSDMLMPRANTQENLRRFSEIAHGLGDSVIGLVNTVWCPGRMLCGTELFAFALGGALFQDPQADAQAVIARFVTERYGVTEETDELATAVLELSRTVPDNTLMRQIMQTQTSKNAPNGPITKEDAQPMHAAADSAKRLHETFAGYQDRVTRHADEFENYLLVCDVLSWVSRIATYRLDPGDAELGSTIMSDGAALIQRCRADWARRRYADDPKRDNDPYGEEDGLICNLSRAVSGLEAANSGTPINV